MELAYLGKNKRILSEVYLSGGGGPGPTLATALYTVYVTHGRRVCKAHLGTCLGENNW